MASLALASGGILLVLLALGHSALGERFVLRPLLARELPPFLGSRGGMGRVLRVSWHLLSLAWIGLGALLLVEAAAPARVGARDVLAATFALTAVVIGATSRGRHLAWVGFAAAAGCAAWP